MCGIPSLLVLLARVFYHPDTVHVLHGDQFLLKIVTQELIIRAIAKDALLFELLHEHLLHLFGGQLAILVESEGLQVAVRVLVQLYLVLNQLNSSLKDTIVTSGLPDLELPGVGGGSTRLLGATNAVGSLRWLLIQDRSVVRHLTVRCFASLGHWPNIEVTVESAQWLVPALSVCC